MMNRRQVLGLAAEEPQCGLPAGYFPDVVVEGHDGRRARFWSDLVRGKTVVLHVFSLAGEAAYPVADNLAKVQALVGGRMGRDVFLYSLTTDPEHDTPRALRDFAAAHGAGPGWLFLTGEPAAMELLRSRLFLHDAGTAAAAGAHAEHAAAPIQDCSRGLLRYGNAAVGLWGSVPARTDPAWIAERIAWLAPRAPAAGAPRRRGPLPLAALAGLLLGLGAAAGFAQHPHPQPPLAPSCQTTEGNVTTIVTGESHFPQSYPFVDPPGTNLLPTVYTNLFDSLGNEVQNTLPSTPTVFYNLHDGEPVVTAINPISPTQDLDALWDRLRDVGPRDPVESELIRAAIQNGIDILEGRPVRNRAYSGLPLLHYNGPEKIKKVLPIYDATGKVVGGNVDVHQVWYDNHFESDTGLLDVSGLGNALDVTWTVTYTIDVLTRGEDDFSPYVMYWNLVPPDAPHPPTPPPPCIPPSPPPAGKRPGMGMDQSFFPMQEGTRTVLKIKMAPGPYYKLIYTWGWRMHPPRVQVMDDATMPVAGKTLAQWEIDTFGPAPTSSEEARSYAIAQIGDLSPAKKMWKALRAARDAAGTGDWKTVRAQADAGWSAFEDWKERNQLPKGVELDKDADLTLFYVNNTIYGEFTQGTLINFPPFQTRGTQVKVTLINGDYYQRGYINVDFGGGRGWENQYKSSVKVAGSGCWFTFGRNYWWINTAAPVMLPPATRDPYKPSVQKVHITYNFDPGRRLRFYQFDPLHHDVAVFSVH